MVMLVQLQSIYFLYKIHSNAVPLGEVVLGGIFLIKVSLSWEWYKTFYEILHYKLFSLPLFSTTNQTDHQINTIRSWLNIFITRSLELLFIIIRQNQENVGVMVAHTVLVYSTTPNGAQSSEKHLIGFKNVHVSAGTHQRVRMNLHVCKHLSRADEFGIRRISMGEHILHIGYDLKHQISVQVDLGNWLRSCMVILRLVGNYIP